VGDASTLVIVLGAVVFAASLAITFRAVILMRRAEQARAALAHSQLLLAEAQRIGNMGSWEWDIKTNKLDWSDQVYRMFGFDPAHRPTYEVYLERVHPEDRDRLVMTIQSALFQGVPYRVRHRIVRPDGEVRTLNAQGEVEFSQDGQPSRMVGVCQDVTELVRLEEEAEEQRRKLRDVIDSMFSFIGLFSIDGTLLDANHAAIEAFGLKRGDVIGRKLWDTYYWSYSPESQARVRQALMRAAAGEVVRDDYVVRVDEGSFLTVDAIYSPLKNRDGRIVQVIGSAVDITARKNAEEAVKASEARLRAIVEAEPECVKVVDKDYRLRELNAAGLRMIGAKDIEEVRGHSVLDLLDPRFHDSYVEAVAKVFRGETTFQQFEIVSLDGTRRWMEQHAAPLFDPAHGDQVREMIAVTRDVTERVLMEQTAQRVRDQLEQAQRIADIGSWEWDFASGELSWSDQCYRIVGWDPAEGKPTLERFMRSVHRDDRAKLEATIRAGVEEGASCDYDHRVVWPNGEVRVVHQLGEVKRDASGRPVRMLGTTQDVTELWAARAELEASKLRAEAANQAKSRFVASMSHELRTPLNAIIGFSELLLGDEGALAADRRAEYARDINTSGKHLLSVINDILDVSRIEAGKITLDEDEVSLQELVDTTARMVRPRAEETGVVVELKLARDLPLVLADRRLLLQTLLNLASNAVKFTERGGRVEIAARLAPEGSVEIAVGDTGIGMSAADVARVGEPFLQVDGRLARKFEGTGLGLVIAKRLAEMHGGTLAIESQLGAGTTMTIRLPASRVVPAPVVAAAS
jgi:PAS domain S-box-containing protein